MAERIPAADYAKRWARVALKTGPSDLEAACDAAQRLYALAGFKWRGEVHVLNPAEFAAYSAECGACLNKGIISNYSIAAMNLLSDHPPDYGVSRLQDEYVAIVGRRQTSAFTTLGVTGSNFMAGQGMTMLLMCLEHLLDRFGPALGQRYWWCEPWFAAAAVIAKNCWETFFGEEGCVLLGHPATMSFDQAGRLHNLTGPALAWPAWEHFSVHGVQVPGLFVIERDSLNIHTVLNEPNQERRRAFVSLYGEARLLKEAGTLVAQDDWGKLWSLQVHERDRESIVMVQVLNSTPEPDGTFKDYFLRVAPDLHPLGNNRQGWVAGQVPTPLNAIASTFGMTGVEYAAALEFQS